MTDIFGIVDLVATSELVERILNIFVNAKRRCSATVAAYSESGFRPRTCLSSVLFVRSQLPAQAQLIAREFSLSSISGIQLYLCLPKSPTSRARLTESSWRVLWADHLEGRSHAETLRGANGLRKCLFVFSLSLSRI